MINENEEESPYCPVCGACGIDECCSRYMCQHKPGCLYPEYENGIWTRIKRPFHHAWWKFYFWWFRKKYKKFKGIKFN